MGSEASCVAHYGKKSSEGTALLETDELIFKGEFRLRIPYKSVETVQADGPFLTLKWKPASGGKTSDTRFGAGGTLRLELGKAAARWAEKIRNPPGLLNKLGIRRGETLLKVALFESATEPSAAFDEAFLAQLRQLVKLRTASLTASLTGEDDLIFLGAESRKELARIAALRKRMRDDAVLWVVYPKGRPDPRETDVLAAGRAAGLKDNKVARFSETHTALRFVVPSDARSKTLPTKRPARVKSTQSKRPSKR